MPSTPKVPLIEKVLLFIGIPVTKQNIFYARLAIIFVAVVIIIISFSRSESAGSRYGNLEEIRQQNPQLDL